MENSKGVVDSVGLLAGSSPGGRNLASASSSRWAAGAEPVLRPEELSYHLLQVRGSECRSEPRLEQAYRCWQQVWSETFYELDGVERVYSDEFTRQHEVGALFLNDACIGLTGFRWIDLALPAHQDDSYFKVWSKDSLTLLQRDGSHVCIGSNLTVHRAWRGRIRGPSVKELLLALSVQRFLVSPADVLAGTMRNDRAMNILGYQLGFTPLCEGAVHHGVRVDLVAFYRDVVEQRPRKSPAQGLVEELWADTQRRSNHE